MTIFYITRSVKAIYLLILFKVESSPKHQESVQRVKIVQYSAMNSTFRDSPLGVFTLVVITNYSHIQIFSTWSVYPCT